MKYLIIAGFVLFLVAFFLALAWMDPMYAGLYLIILSVSLITERSMKRS